MAFHPRERRRPRPPRRSSGCSAYGAAAAGRLRPVAAGGLRGRRRRAAGGEEGGVAALAARRPGDAADASTTSRPIEDGLPPETRDAEGLQLRGVHRPRRARRVRGGVRRARRGHDVHEHGRGGDQAGVRRGRLRRVLPDAGPSSASWPPASCCSRSTSRTCPTWTTSGSRCRTRSTTRAACTPCRTPSTRPGIGYRDRRRRPRRPTTTTTRTTSSGTRPTAGQVYLLEDDREVFGMALLRRDPETDVNTEDADADRRRPRRRRPS